MNTSEKWRTGHLGGNVAAHQELVSKFKSAYEAEGQPDKMAMFVHMDTFGTPMALTITPESVRYCPFTSAWDQSEKPPTFGAMGWEAGDIKLKPKPE